MADQVSVSTSIIGKTVDSAFTEVTTQIDALAGIFIAPTDGAIVKVKLMLKLIVEGWPTGEVAGPSGIQSFTFRFEEQVGATLAPTITILHTVAVTAVKAFVNTQLANSSFDNIWNIKGRCRIVMEYTLPAGY